MDYHIVQHINLSFSCSSQFTTNCNGVELHLESNCNGLLLHLESNCNGLHLHLESNCNGVELYLQRSRIALRSRIASRIATESRRECLHPSAADRRMRPTRDTERRPRRLATTADSI